MSTIIGFIPPDGICQTAEITLPVGFLATGERIEPNNDKFANCVLIFLEDTRYDPDDHWDCFQGNEKDALLFQHNSKKDYWDSQTQWLSNHNWQPRRFASFSRTETEGDFMKATRKLLCNNDNCHATTIENFLQRIKGKHLFKLLDNYVAWGILFSIEQPNDNTLLQKINAVNITYELLPSNLQKEVGYILDPKKAKSLPELINAANKQAFDLI